jgi:hypothetical protein
MKRSAGDFRDRAEQGTQEQMRRMEQEKRNKIMEEADNLQQQYDLSSGDLQKELSLLQGQFGNNLSGLEKQFELGLDKNAIFSNLAREGLNFVGNYDQNQKNKKLEDKLYDMALNSDQSQLSNLMGINKVKDIKKLNPKFKLLDLLSSSEGNSKPRLKLSDLMENNKKL